MARGLDGVKVKIALDASWVTVPLTPGETVKVVALTVATFMASLKVAVTAELKQTPTEPVGGLTESTVGGGLHPLAEVVKLQTKLLARALPNRSWTPVVMFAV
jgi:hypothetical protein